ncbi:hypothetical protein OKW76_01255 [Sphingomonas sp. S1-29]|uniref:YtxH domain-containing protein n=1 Tax=Sphingomonas qomolangmaensis TaxID=2918765 RepID=A0ABY5L9Q9_9SPHN|nr:MULTISPECIES: hypothetical protein [Sphingomonas]UUL83709.1 hypothetical protein NMP03_05775 [Sphingomonas qomolangmaensis]UZK69739.1 hypothetical protein OKW76_01255 [Sphingomonas sp. S1-29]
MVRHRKYRIGSALLMVAGAGVLLAFIQPSGAPGRTIGERWDAITRSAGEYLRQPV